MIGLLTASTCGDACWHAVEDICHCSCGGANHGCLRTADGVRPARTSRIQGDMHTLAGVGMVTGDAHNINRERMRDKFWYGAITARDWGSGPAKVRPATESQIAKWPELASYRPLIGLGWLDRHLTTGDSHDPWPDLLWVQA